METHPYVRHIYVAIICLVQDEAHNLDSDCRDAASLVLDPAKVELTLDQVMRAYQ